ncbi:MAG: Fe-S cluster assembly protein SufD [Longimonas sp.]|uniref:Fe-S cluster assembly protein SufD n=1 Tax=Longimonas sp. TaxID=2039626 RepID=UPI00334D786B
MSTTTLDTSAQPIDRFVSAFQVNHGQALNGTNASIAKHRTAAIERFKELGVPTRKQEAWKYTDIASVLSRPYTLPLGAGEATVSAADLDPYLIDDLDAHVLVLVNGRPDLSLSQLDNLPDAVTVGALKDAGDHPAFEAHYGAYADTEEEALTALNTAFVQDGAFIHVPEGVTVEQPILLLHVNAAQEDLFMQPRHLFVIEEDAKAHVIGRQVSLTDARTFTNTVMEMYVGERGFLDHYLIQEEGEDASQVLSRFGYHEDNSILSTDTFTFSGEVVRNNMTLTPDGAHCETNLYGLVIGYGDMHVDNNTLVDHVHADCVSNELYKHILNDRSTAVFNGKVFVHRDSQRIDAYQSNDSLVLSDEADIYTKPELEIYADDVVCSHGATAGQLDEEGLFYLRSRGLDQKRARILMMQAFAQKVIDVVDIAPLKALIEDRVQERLRTFAS